jgi:hypothetical protein
MNDYLGFGLSLALFGLALFLPLLPDLYCQWFQHGATAYIIQSYKVLCDLNGYNCSTHPSFEFTCLRERK